MNVLKYKKIGLISFVLICGASVFSLGSFALGSTVPVQEDQPDLSFQCMATYEINQSSRDGCVKDDDCSIIAADCCGCNASGWQSAILSTHSAAALECRSDKCATIVCAQVISSHASCRTNNATCVLGSCVLN